ncbi:MAG: hypothetical protein ACRC5R_04975 [Mycoplasmatales bacterium]
MKLELKNELNIIIGKLCDISCGYQKNNDDMEAAAVLHIAKTLDEFLEESAIREPVVLKNPEMKLESVLIKLDTIKEMTNGEEINKVIINAYTALKAIFVLYK